MPGLSRLRSSLLVRISILACVTALSGGNSAFSAPTDSTPRPSAPAPLSAPKNTPENPFRCDRLVTYGGKTLPCDSALRRDGESLRPILESVPDALDELDIYQAGRSSIAFAAYTGTAGVVLAITSGLLTNLVIDESRNVARRDVAKITRVTGLGLALGSIGFGLWKLRDNEDHLQLAILKYNAVHPDHPIEVQFKMEF